MRILYALAVGMVLASGWLAWSIQEVWEEAKRTRDANEALQARVHALDAELAEVRGWTELAKPKYAVEAISDFYSRSIEAGEVLGVGVRIETPQGPASEFTDLKYGLMVTRATIKAAAPIAGAAALFSMLEEEIAELPVAVRAAEAQIHDDSVALQLEVDVFGRREP
jgi:hypothetical protein